MSKQLISTGGYAQNAYDLSTPQKRAKGVNAAWQGFFDAWRGPAAEVIQTRWRGYAARKYVRAFRGGHLLRHSGQRTLETAAIVIQRHWRGWLGRQVAAARSKAVRDLQRYWRGYKCRREWPKLRRRWRIQNEAAIEIQRIVRGYLVRLHMGKIPGRKPPITRAQAAARIQAHWRGYLARRHKRLEWLRAQKGKRELGDRRRHAVALMAAMYRSHKVRQALQQLRAEGLIWSPRSKSSKGILLSAEQMEALSSKLRQGLVPVITTTANAKLAWSLEVQYRPRRRQRRGSTECEPDVSDPCLPVGLEGVSNTPGEEGVGKAVAVALLGVGSSVSGSGGTMHKPTPPTTPRSAALAGDVRLASSSGRCAGSGNKGSATSAGNDANVIAEEIQSTARSSSGLSAGFTSLSDSISSCCSVGTCDSNASLISSNSSITTNVGQMKSSRQKPAGPKSVPAEVSSAGNGSQGRKAQQASMPAPLAMPSTTADKIAGGKAAMPRPASPMPLRASSNSSTDGRGALRPGTPIRRAPGQIATLHACSSTPVLANSAASSSGAPKVLTGAPSSPTLNRQALVGPAVRTSPVPLGNLAATANVRTPANTRPLSQTLTRLSEINAPIGSGRLLGTDVSTDSSLQRPVPLSSQPAPLSTSAPSTSSQRLLRSQSALLPSTATTAAVNASSGSTSLRRQASSSAKAAPKSAAQGPRLSKPDKPGMRRPALRPNPVLTSGGVNPLHEQVMRANRGGRVVNSQNKAA